MSKPIFDVAQIVSDESITSVEVQKRVLQHINHLSERVRTLDGKIIELQRLYEKVNK
jgi:TolA-binding protein